MGRLFWKFFLFLWLAQLTTVAGVATAIWLSHGPPHPPAGPPPDGVAFFWPPLLSGAVASLIFAGLLAWYFAKPIRSLRAAFADLAAEQLETRVGASIGSRQDELADLGEGFDRMAERLQSLLEAQRRLLHDVSHELRSPLARIQAAADLIRQQPGRGEEFLARIDRDAARMDGLVGELLSLARLEAPVGERTAQTVDLGPLLGTVVEDARLEAVSLGTPITLHIDPGLLVRGDAELLRRAIENVVRNALRHAGGAGSVEVRARGDGARLRVSVSDHGPGVLPSELGAIFEPFVRGRADSPPGHGLGLALTRRVMVAHGGEVSAGNRPAGGLCVSMALPRVMDTTSAGL